MQNCISGDVNLGEHIISESLKFCAAIDKEKSSEINRFQRALAKTGNFNTNAPPFLHGGANPQGGGAIPKPMHPHQQGEDLEPLNNYNTNPRSRKEPWGLFP